MLSHILYFSEVFKDGHALLLHSSFVIIHPTHPFSSFWPAKQHVQTTNLCPFQISAKWWNHNHRKPVLSPARLHQHRKPEHAHSSRRRIVRPNAVLVWHSRLGLKSERMLRTVPFRQHSLWYFSLVLLHLGLR